MPSSILPSRQLSLLPFFAQKHNRCHSALPRMTAAEEDFCWIHLELLLLLPLEEEEEEFAVSTTAAATSLLQTSLCLQSQLQQRQLLDNNNSNSSCCGQQPCVHHRAADWLLGVRRFDGSAPTGRIVRSEISASSFTQRNRAPIGQLVLSETTASTFIPPCPAALAKAAPIRFVPTNTTRRPQLPERRFLGKSARLGCT